MATSTIVAIPTTASAPAADDYLELGGNTNGSRKILATAIGTGALAAGVTTLNSATATIFAISFGTTLGSAPARIEWSITGVTASNFVVGQVLSDTISTTGFTFAVSGSIGDATHKLAWKAFAS